MRKLCRDGKLPYFRVGRLIKLDSDEVKAWLANAHVSVTPRELVGGHA